METLIRKPEPAHKRRCGCPACRATGLGARVATGNGADGTHGTNATVAVVGGAHGLALQAKPAAENSSPDSVTETQEPDEGPEPDAEAAAVQRQPADASAPAAPATPPDVAATPPAAGPDAPVQSSTLLVEDDAADVAPGQMRKSEFIAQLRAALCATADEALAGTIWSAAGCPWIEQWLGYYSRQPVAHGEAAIRRYAPEAAAATTAQGYIAPICERARSGIRNWLATGELSGVPPGVSPQLPVTPPAGATTAEARPVQQKAAGNAGAASTNPTTILAQLGPGTPLEGSVSSRIGAALGEDYGGVRIHTDTRAASLSSGMRARAFTVGRHVAFGDGEYRPGTLMGDALLAHELAHVSQQREGETQGLLPAGGEEYQALEMAADQSALGAVSSLWGRSVTALAGFSSIAGARLKTGLRLQKCSLCDSSPSPAPAPAPVPKPSGPDQHAGVSLPDAATAAAIAKELHPTTATAGPAAAATPWDGSLLTPGLTPADILDRNKKRAALKTAVTAALKAHLDAELPGIKKLAATRKLPMTAFEGPGKAAKAVVDSHFGALTSAAAFTPAQSAAITGFQFKASGPGQTLFDATDPAQRTAAGLAIDPDDVANWMAETDKASQAAQAAHSFDPHRAGSTEESTFLKDEILKPFVSARRSDLFLYDQYGFAESQPGAIVIGPQVMPGFSDTPGPKGEPSPAERAVRWDAWKTLVHEYLHTRAHPNFELAAKGNRIMTEGFTEMFTKEVLTAELPGAPGNAALCAQVEGGSYTPPTAAMIGPYSPGSYKAYLEHAENIRDKVIGPPGGDNAVKAAFFQGHVELLGLEPVPSASKPPVIRTGAADTVMVPSGVSTLAQLAVAAGVPEADILAANPGLTAAGPLPKELRVPGCRDHVVVWASGGTGASFAVQSETKAQIAAQNGVAEADLDRANPGAAWGSLLSGEHILIPKH